MQKQINIDVGTAEFTFNVTLPLYNKYLNSITPSNKIQPATNFLMSTVEPEQSKDLKALLTQPGAALHLAAAVVEDYQPEFNFTVKKSSSVPSK